MNDDTKSKRIKVNFYLLENILSNKQPKLMARPLCPPTRQQARIILECFAQYYYYSIQGEVLYSCLISCWKFLRGERTSSHHERESSVVLQSIKYCDVFLYPCRNNKHGGRFESGRQQQAGSHMNKKECMPSCGMQR